MGSLEKFSEAIAVVGQKKDAVENIMGLLMREWEAAEKNSKTIRDLSAQVVGELELKHKRSKAVVESVQVSYEMLSSKKRWLEEGLKKLDDKVMLVREVLKDLQAEQVQSRIMRDSMDKQLKELALKEQQFQDLSETLKMTPRHVEERKNELDLMEIALDERKDEMDSMQKQLEARELEACTEQKLLKKMRQEMDAEKDRLEGDMQSRKAFLVKRESFITMKERTLMEGESEFARKQKFWEAALESRKAALVSKELDVDLKEKLLKKRETLMQAKAMRDPREKSVQQSPSGILMEGNKRGFVDAGEVFIKDSPRRDGKRRCSGDGLTEHNESRPHLKISGSDDKLQTKTSEEVVVLDDSESDSEAKAVLKDTLKLEVVPHYNVGETWACLGAKDRMPRSYLKILGVAEQGGNVRLQVEWMKPCPRFEGEKEWITAGLPVGCGTFEPSRKGVEYPHSLFQPIFSAGNPCTIVPVIGETWAIYKDWNIKTWSSSPDIPRRCKYEICEILPYPQCGSLSMAVRVACLDKVRGSTCSFQRRSKKEEDSFLIQPDSLYIFSHRVPSSKSSCNVPAGVFELDQNALPSGL